MCSANDQEIGAVSVDDGLQHSETGPAGDDDREEDRPVTTGEGSATPSATTGPPAPATAASQGRWSRLRPVVARLVNRSSARATAPVAAPLTTAVPSAAVVTSEQADTDEPLVEVSDSAEQLTWDMPPATTEPAEASGLSDPVGVADPADAGDLYAPCEPEGSAPVEQEERAADGQVEQLVQVEPVEGPEPDEQVERFVPVEPVEEPAFGGEVEQFEQAEEPVQAEQPQYYTPVEYSGEWAWAEPVVYEFPAEPEVPPAVETAEESAPVDGTEPAAAADAGAEADAKQGTAAQKETESVHTPPQRALDIGLLVLRVAVGAAALVHGLQKLVGAWGGPGLGGFESILANAPDPSIGFDGSATGWLAPLGAIAETEGGALLIVGLVSPVAASTVLGVLVVGALYKVTLAGGLWYFADGPRGIEYSLLLICASLVILILGPGRLAVDYGRGWTTRPTWGSWALAVLGIGAAVALWVVFNGTNPLDSPGNPG